MTTRCASRTFAVAAAGPGRRAELASVLDQAPVCGHDLEGLAAMLGEPVVARIVGHMDVADGEQSVEHVVGASRILLIDLASCDTLLVDMRSQDPP